MSASRPQRRDKRVERRTTRQGQKQRLRKAMTKAELRKRFDARIRRVVESLARFDRTANAGGRERILRDSLRLLDACLDEKPQSHLLREQRRLCMDALQEILRDPVAAGGVALERLLDDPARVRLVRQARIHAPPSDRKSWN